MRLFKICDGCSVSVKNIWHIKSKGFYCYGCYQRILKERRGDEED